MLSMTDTVLVVIDEQDKLLPKDKNTREALLENTVKLISASRVLGIPVLVTEQNPERLGPTTEMVLEALGNVPRLGKLEFGCTRNAGFLAALKQCHRRQLLLAGVEAHICVLQTALGAKESGYSPFVVSNAVASQDSNEYAAGLRRMEQAGVEIVTTQMALFELLGAAATPEFKQLLPYLK